MGYLSDIQKGLQQWVSKELKITTIFQEQYEVRPQATPYATIRLGIIGRYGFMDESSGLDDQGIVKVDGHRNSLVRVDVNGQGAMELALQLQASLSKVTVLSSLWNDYGISILDRGSVVNIEELLETKGLERAVLEIRIGYAVQYEENQGLIEHVEIETKYNDEVIATDVIPPIEES